MIGIEDSGVFAPILRSYLSGGGRIQQFAVALERGVDGTQLFDDCCGILRRHCEANVAETSLVAVVLSDGVVPATRKAELDRLFKGSPRENELALWDVMLHAMGSQQILVAGMRCKRELIGDVMNACMERASTERVATTSARGRFLTVAAVDGG